MEGNESMIRHHNKKIKIYQVDAFTNENFKGNPAGVCILKKPIPEYKMQLIAREMNLSETAFAMPMHKNKNDIKNNYILRWFTPEKEVDLCGHATLATSKVLFEALSLEGEEINYETKSGKLVAKKDEEGIILNFPLDEAINFNIKAEELLQALGVKNYINIFLGRNTKKLIIHVGKEEDVRALSPNFSQMIKWNLSSHIKGVAVTALSEKYDFVSRYFNPWVGVNEDPVTGSVHTVLASYWRNILGKDILKAYQASPRGGEIILKVLDGKRVNLIGDGVIIIEGYMYI